MIKRYLLWALLGAVAVGLTHTGTSVGFKSADWAAWVGAIGTVGTLIGTIYLATAQSRRKSKDDLTLARLHGASMVLRLNHAEAMVTTVCQTLFTSLQTPIELQVEHFNDMKSKLSSIRLWGMSELVPLIALPNNTAVKLAQAADQMSSAERLLTNAIARYPNLSSADRANFSELLYGTLKTTLTYIREAVNVCNSETGALHRQGQ